MLQVWLLDPRPSEGVGCQFGQLLESKRGVDEIAQNEARRFWLIAQK